MNVFSTPGLPAGVRGPTLHRLVRVLLLRLVDEHLVKVPEGEALLKVRGCGGGGGLVAGLGWVGHGLGFGRGDGRVPDDAERLFGRWMMQVAPCSFRRMKNDPISIP